MKKKTKQDFQELIKTEHGNCRSLPKLFLSLLPPGSQLLKKMLSSSLQLRMLPMWSAGCPLVVPLKDGERARETDTPQLSRSAVIGCVLISRSTAGGLQHPGEHQLH